MDDFGNSYEWLADNSRQGWINELYRQYQAMGHSGNYGFMELSHLWFWRGVI